MNVNPRHWMQARWALRALLTAWFAAYRPDAAAWAVFAFTLAVTATGDARMVARLVRRRRTGGKTGTMRVRP